MTVKMLSTILILSLFLLSLGWAPEVLRYNYVNASNDRSPSPVPILESPNPIIREREQTLPKTDYSSMADSIPINGILNPLIIEQSGYATSELINARTDTFTNLNYELPIDDVHDWVGSEAHVSITNLTRLYVVNGTFDEGIPGVNIWSLGSRTGNYFPYGWDSYSTTLDTTTKQRTAYYQKDSFYTLVENEGKTIGTGSNMRFQHSLNTEVIWNQTISNTPYTEDFVFSSNFLYKWGPIDPALAASITLIARIDGTEIWSVSLASLAAHDVWYNTGNVIVNMPGASDKLNFEIGLKINVTLSLNPDTYGILDANYITAHLDDVSLIGVSPPEFDSVDMRFYAGSSSTAIEGTLGSGSASILNSSYWDSTSVPVFISSNTSVRFSYTTQLRSHRFTESNWKTDVSALGAVFTINYGKSATVVFYTYIGYFGYYQNPSLHITHPIDWANSTIYDSFLSNVTSQCSIKTGEIEVPSTLLNRLGWWEIRLDSPNYAKSIEPQILDSIWRDETVFRVGNQTRAEILIGTSTQTLGSLTDVNVTWSNPSDTLWFSELIAGGSLGQIFSSSQTLTSGSSPAGQWWVEVYWTNGTEVAYNRARFEVHHTAELLADPYIIDTDAGLTITGLVRYIDSDTGAYLMDPSATITANWSTSSIFFVPNAIRNWWEGSLDTSLVGAGVFTVVVNASRLYYDDASCEILVRSIQMTRLSSPNAPWTADTWGNLVTLTFRYELYNYGTMEWFPVSSTDVFVSVNWTAGSWSVEATAEPGIFVVYLDSSVMNSSTFLLNTTFGKPYHQTQTLFLTLIISPVTSSLHIIGEISARVNLDQEYPLKMSYLDGDGYPIVYANVAVDSVTPSIGLIHSDVVEVIGESGNYSVSLTPHAAGVFTIRFMATAQNVEPAIAIFVVVVNDIDTVLEIAGPASTEIGLTDVYKTTFRYETLNGTGIEKANIEIYLSSDAKSTIDWEWSEIESGNYSVEFSSSSSGTYLITIAAFKQYYQSASSSIFLVVREITTQLTSLNGTAEIIGFGKSYQLFVSYTNGTGYGLSGASVTIENVVPATGLWWGNISEVANGIYSISLRPDESNTFTVLIQASLDDHQTRFILFTLTATAIPTSLNVMTPGTTISLDQTFVAYLRFHDEDNNNLTDAILTVQNAPTGISFTDFDDLGNGIYRVNITPLEIGTFDIIFKATKSGYQNGFASLAIGAVRIPTHARLASGLSSDSMMFSESYELFVNYERTDTGVNVTGATMNLLASPNTGISWSYIEVDDGYLITIETTRTGRWTLSVTLQKQAHVSSTVEFILDVNPISIAVELLSENSVIEGRFYTLLVKLTQQGTSIPVTDAYVSYRISVARTGEFLEMQETSTAGVYTAQFSLPYSDVTDYRLEIRMEKDNYLYVPGVFEQPIVKTINFTDRMYPIVTGGSGILAAFLILFSALRISSKKKKAQLERDLVNKRRFDDADNIIGVIILHKKSGIPIYSKMMKGGFEEGIVAAFITAVTHFREEFEMVSDDALTVIPISDIIRAVSTRNLICAFITVRSASMEHNRNMEAFARQIGTYLDDLLDEVSGEVVDSRIEDMLDYIFNTTMNGSLLRFYKVATSAKFPKQYQVLDEILHDTDTRHCTKPVLLAKSVTNYGVSEARGCTLILELIEKELIVPCEGDEAEGNEIDFSDFFSKPDRAESSDIEE